MSATPTVNMSPKTYQRFNIWHRAEHLLALSSFVVLAVTGLPQKFAEQVWAQSLIGLFGGIEVTRQIHHIAAIALMLEVVYHLVHLVLFLQLALVLPLPSFYLWLYW